MGEAVTAQAVFEDVRQLAVSVRNMDLLLWPLLNLIISPE
jgi:hypothetical protein